MPQIVTHVPYSPFRRTAEVHLAFRSHRIVTAVTGARGGKTTLGAAKVMDAAIEQPGFDFDDMDRGEPYTIAVAAPTYPMLDRVVLPAVLRRIPDALKIGDYNQGRRLLKVHGKKGETWIYFLSCVRVDSWQGLKLYGTWIDEFPLIKESMYDEAQTRLSDRKGWMLLTGTPQGPNWAKTRLYDAWRDQTDPEISFHTWRTVDNPYIDRTFIESKRRTMPAKYFKRTFEASWDVFEGQVYEEYLDAVHRVPRNVYRFLLPDGQTVVGSGPTTVKLDKLVAGQDWGFAAGHPGAIVVVGRSKGKWYVLEDIREEGVFVTPPVPGADSWVTRALRLVAKWQISTIWCDGESPENIQIFKRYRLPARSAVKDVKEGIEAVAGLIHVGEDGEPSMYFIENAYGCLDEIVFYHWKEGSRKEEPDKVGDHCMDALRYAVYSELKHGRFRREPRYEPRAA